MKRLAGQAAFAALLAGETVSAIGSGLSGFAIAVYAYQKSGSVTGYAMLSLVSIAPALLLGPFAGALVDRLPRKRIIVLGNLVSTVGTLLLALLARTGHLALWHVALLAMLNSAVTTFHLLAFEAATTLLVPSRNLGRASGLAHGGNALAQLAAPALAGALTAFIDLPGILLVDAASFAFALGGALICLIPDPAAGAPADTPATSGALEGLRYLLGSPGLRGTLAYQTVVNFAMAMATVLMLPLVLGLGTQAAFGAILSAAGLGMLAGGLLLASWAGPARRLHTLLAGGALLSVSLLASALFRSLTLLGACAFAVGLSIALVNSSIQVIWQLRVPPALQGRVFAARQTLIGAALPVAYLIAGPLSDRVFEPALRPGGALLAALGPTFGAGPGRGVAVLLCLVGALSTLATAWAALSPRLRGVDDPRPDSIVPPYPNQNPQSEVL